MDLESLVQQAQAALENPVVVPCLIWAAVALFAVLFAYSLSKPKRKRGRTPSKAEGGTTYVEGVRRSTRAHKEPVKFSDEYLPSPAAKTPGRPKTPRASKLAAEAEAVTVSPKRRSTRTPAKAEAAEAGEPTPRRRGRPAKAE